MYKKLCFLKLLLTTWLSTCYRARSESRTSRLHTLNQEMTRTTNVIISTLLHNSQVNYIALVLKTPQLCMKNELIYLRHFPKGRDDPPGLRQAERWQQAQGPAEEGETGFSSVSDSDWWPSVMQPLRWEGRGRVEPLLLQVKGGKYNVIKIETERVNSHILFFIPGQPAKTCRPQCLLITDLEQIQTADSGAVRTQPLS